MTLEGACLARARVNVRERRRVEGSEGVEEEIEGYEGHERPEGNSVKNSVIEPRERT